MNNKQDYNEFLKQKITNVLESGFDISTNDLNANLFHFQKYIVQKALKAGRYAIFAECGLGKTAMQLEYAYQITKKTLGKMLILTPLAVKAQTINEANKFNIDISNIDIINYEQINNVNVDNYVGVVLDESSILKNYTGVYKNLLINLFKKHQYKLACTATPSPNDLNEIGNHSEFLGVLDSTDMRSKWFVRDEGMNMYRLKGHAKQDFYNWIRSWAVAVKNPSDIGFDGSKYVLPKLNMIERQVESKNIEIGKLFVDGKVSATEFNKELRLTKVERFSEVVEIINNSNERFIVWVNQNEEADYLKSKLTDYVEVRGSEKTEIKEQKLLDFANNKYKVLITKKKIAQFGLNFQNCNNQIFASLDFSFEGLYQAIRRSYRFGQKNEVNIYIITTDSMDNVVKSIQKKQNQFDEMINELSTSTNSIDYNLTLDYDFKETISEDYWIMNGDSVELIDKLANNSIDFSVFSPPFSDLFTYSNNLRDLGNCESLDLFFQQNQYLLDKLYSKIKNGRLVAVHTKDLAKYKNSSGYSGMYDFTGDYHRAMEKAGFKYHSKVTIWIDPVLEMQRTKTQRLLYKQLTKDSTYSGYGMPEYVTIFRKWEGNEEDWEPVNYLNKQNFPLDVWQRWASPVWFDIRRTNVLNNYRLATKENDEKHICPMQLDVIERLICMFTNEKEKVFTPFLGIGSEVFEAVRLNRFGIGIELKESYYDTALSNIKSVIEKRSQQTIFE